MALATSSTAAIIGHGAFSVQIQKSIKKPDQMVVADLSAKAAYPIVPTLCVVTPARTLRVR
jgi:hypothetical protein